MIFVPLCLVESSRRHINQVVYTIIRFQSNQLLILDLKASITRYEVTQSKIYAACDNLPPTGF